MWVKSSSADNPASQEFLIDKESSSAGYAIYFDTDGDIIFGIDDDTTWTPDDKVGDIGVDYYDGTWHHITATKEGTTSIKIYIDGVLKETVSVTATGTLVNAASIIIGDKDATDNGDEFNGYIDEVKVYSYKMTEEQIKIDYNHGLSAKMGTEYTPPANLIGWWAMDEASGSTAYDVSGNSNEGTLVGDTAWKSAADCKYGSCLSFDGTGDYVNAGNFTGVNNSSAFTISLWAKQVSYVDNAGLIAKYNTGTNQRAFVFLTFATNEIYGYLSSNGTSGVAFDSAGGDAGFIANDIWYYFTFVYDGSNIYFYKDGKYITTDSTTVTQIYNSSAQLDIGASYNSSTPFNGLIDNVMIYDRALTQEEISWLYNRGRP